MEMDISLNVTMTLPMDEYLAMVKELKQLRKRNKKLRCLENGGVDNWEGYDFAMEDYYDEDDE